MSGGLVALLDDIATLAKVTASSIDDVAAGAVKASSKAVGVVIDDTAVTPQYVSGLSPARELPIIGKIARGSLINKLFIILPIALVLTWFAPRVLPFLLIVGGAYLCFEGGEKVLEKLGWLPGDHAEHDETGASTAEELERGIVSSATRTDLILSAEIMLVSLAGLSNETGIMRVAVLVAVAFFMTFFVYGLVALLVKADDFGLHLAKDAVRPEDNRPGPVDNLGRTIVRVMPHVFNVIGIVGTVAMLWVGGHLVIENLAEVGVPVFHHLLETAEHAVSAAGSFVTWLVETLLSGIFGIVLGAVIAWIVVGISMLGRKVRGRD
ncbi:DUF808 domain-containing protein [Schaalia odontolytica]|uniref:Inner membrane protein yedI n=1 Tax=Schaalia odontolytica TaxID=1660 RepID=A0A2X0U3X2_9ACTO|nr:DUF808 domain-containing protein [Schaalia odontolytica]WMS28165.1 DUF808 domain-containing protein [Schaalia odontolytica]SPT56449.1 Inner membrane protein yedI [Schaalia odontolytica]